MNIPEILIIALIAVESGGDPNAIGDGGAAYGILQIHASYVEDASQYARQQWVHEDAFDPDLSIQILQAYMSRYATERRAGGPVTAEHVARIHNGGPNGHRRSSTDRYWEKVKAELYRRGAASLAEGAPLQTINE